MTEALVKKAIACLEAEKEALLASDFERLEPIRAELASVLTPEGDEPLDKRQLDRLRDMVVRNRRLLEAAMEGVRDAQSRLRTLRDVQQSLRTYGADGKRANFSMENHRLERKA